MQYLLRSDSVSFLLNILHDPMWRPLPLQPSDTSLPMLSTASKDMCMINKGKVVSLPCYLLSSPGVPDSTEREDWPLVLVYVQHWMLRQRFCESAYVVAYELVFPTWATPEGGIHILKCVSISLRRMLVCCQVHSQKCTGHRRARTSHLPCLVTPLQ